MCRSRRELSNELIPTSFYSQKSASIQPRTSSSKLYSIFFNIIQSCPYSAACFCRLLESLERRFAAVSTAPRCPFAFLRSSLCAARRGEMRRVLRRLRGSTGRTSGTQSPPGGPKPSRSSCAGWGAHIVLFQHRRFLMFFGHF